jgi:hypothetical protein
MTQVKETMDRTLMVQKNKVMPMAEITTRWVEKEDLRTTMPVEISNANTATRLICHIPLFIHI